MLQLKVKKLYPDAKLPVKATPYAAGFDLFLYLLDFNTVWLRSGERLRLGTGLAMEIPDGFYAQIKPRSGLADKYGIMILAGVCDSDFRNEYQVILYNSGKEDLLLHNGNKFAQMVILPVPDIEIVESHVLSETKRGMDGLGSTGMV